MNTTWVSLRPETEFLSFDATVIKLNDFFSSISENAENAEVPTAITEMVEQRQDLAIEALGGMMFYLQSLNMANDLLSQKSFNIYDPIRKGEGMVLDGQTLSHLEVSPLGKDRRYWFPSLTAPWWDQILLNNEGGSDGTLLQLLQRCITPFGKRLFRLWLTVPLRDVDAINAR
jgi:DNA mismatch repair protein MSH6